ncbi:MAG: NERD domain-containing protein [Saccharospirillum sp.]|nr:NERD domain-containing protein [Saccharospirillum sp.]
MSELEEILAYVSGKDKRIAKQVKGDILKLKAGHSAEQTAAHLLDKQFQESKRAILLHDLRLDLDGDVAQIDHLSINRFGFVMLYETKSFSTGIKIDDEGVFWRWDGYAKRYIEIPSPILQSQRHEVTLKNALKVIGYEALHFRHYVLVDYKAKLIKPKNGTFENVCRPDRLEDVWKKEEKGPIKLNELGAGLKGLGRLVGGKALGPEQLQDVGEKLAQMHTPLQMDVWSRYGLEKPGNEPKPALEPATVKQTPPEKRATKLPPIEKTSQPREHLSSSKAAKLLKLSTQEFLAKAEKAGLVCKEGEAYVVTAKAEKHGIENKVFRNIPYVSWPVPVIEKIGASLAGGKK